MTIFKLNPVFSTIILIALSYTLTAQSLGSLTNREVYDFDIGDEFQYQRTYHLSPQDIVVYSQRTVVSKCFNAKKDSVFYEFEDFNSKGKFLKKYGPLDSTAVPFYFNNKCQRNNRKSFPYCWDTLYVNNGIKTYEHIFSNGFAAYSGKYGVGIGQTYYSTGCDAGCLGYNEKQISYKKADKKGGMPIENAQIASVRIFPNPANEYVLILTGMPYTRFLVFDTNGRIVYQTYSSYAFDHQSDKIQLENFADGIYIIHFFQENRLASDNRFMVFHK